MLNLIHYMKSHRPALRLPPVGLSALAAAELHWSSGGRGEEPNTLLDHKVGVWEHLRAKHSGDSTVVIDNEDMCLRALLCVLEVDRCPEQDIAEWFADMMNGLE